MDTSTPVRNHNVNDESNVSESCDQDDSEIFLSDSPASLNRLSLEQQPDLLLSQNDDTFMGQSQRVLP